VYDAHSIRSHVPRLFPGTLPELNLGTNSGQSCDSVLSSALQQLLARSGRGWVADGRFQGGWTTRHYGAPDKRVHALQMELACRTYLHEPEAIDDSNWPATFDAARAAPLQALLKQLLECCLAFATASQGHEGSP
jgi:formiminoglutamase